MARQLARRRTRERIAGIALAALGVVVLAVAIFAIRNPHSGTSAAAAGSTTTPAPTPSSGAATRTRSAASSPSVSGSTVPITANSASGVSTTMSLSTAQQTPLVVLNNSMVSGLAAQASKQFENAGWTVTSYGNLQNDIISTCAYYDPSDPTAKAAAKVLKHEFSGIKRVRPKFPQLPAGPIVVVLTGDYSAQ